MAAWLADKDNAARFAGALVTVGVRLGSDSRLQGGLERLVESGARALADQFHDELASLVTGTIELWDAEETSTQLELNSQVSALITRARGFRSAAALMAMIDFVHGGLCPESPYA